MGKKNSLFYQFSSARRFTGQLIGSLRRAIDSKRDDELMKGMIIRDTARGRRRAKAGGGEGEGWFKGALLKRTVRAAIKTAIDSAITDGRVTAPREKFSPPRSLVLLPVPPPVHPWKRQRDELYRSRDHGSDGHRFYSSLRSEVTST